MENLRKLLILHHFFSKSEYLNMANISKIIKYFEKINWNNHIPYRIAYNLKKILISMYQCSGIIYFSIQLQDQKFSFCWLNATVLRFNNLSNFDYYSKIPFPHIIINIKGTDDWVVERKIWIQIWIYALTKDNQSISNLAKL